jgi:alpha-tubulin suppressor-like RCC1 family protein
MTSDEDDAPRVYLLGKTYLVGDQVQFHIRNDAIIHMAAGDQHTIIVTESGRAFAFGDNSSGRVSISRRVKRQKRRYRSAGSRTYEPCR